MPRNLARRCKHPLFGLHFVLHSWQLRQKRELFGLDFVPSIVDNSLPHQQPTFDQKTWMEEGKGAAKVIVLVGGVGNFGIGPCASKHLLCRAAVKRLFDHHSVSSVG